MPPEPPELPPPTLVEGAPAFASMLSSLRGAREIAVDTEADSFFSYREKVCLIQISAVGSDWIVDPLAGFDLAPLGELLADPRRTKIFHDGEFDILVLKRDFGFAIRGLFDTRIAASALGHKSPGLAAVLNEHFGVELDKSMQRSDWSQRPLSPQQISYARFDTHFLERLAARQRQELESRERARMVGEEFGRLERLEPPQREFDPEAFAELKGARTLDRLQLQALRELFVWRDGLARARDLPPFKVLGNEQMLGLARALPRNSRQLVQPGCLYPRQERALGAELLAALERARAKGPLERDPFPSYSSEQRRQYEEEGELGERLKQWRKQEAEQLATDASLVLNRHALERIARQRPRTATELAAIEGLLPWQAEAYAERLAEIVARFERELASGQLQFPLRRGRRGG